MLILAAFFIVFDSAGGDLIVSCKAKKIMLNPSKKFHVELAKKKKGFDIR
jgi:hypothetical protein